MIKSIASVKVNNRRVILRAGFDVPLKKGAGVRGEGEEWEVADETRIKDILPTLNYLIEQKARIIIISHVGRPEGWQMDKSLWPVALKLGEILNYKTVQVTKSLPDYPSPHLYFLGEDITKKNYSKLSKQIAPGNILFLENVRFYPGE